jgi:uncharacterized RDD family membrane protein YckC
VDVEDRVVLTTPEGVTVDLVLAGLGSRLSAALLDLVVRIVLILSVTLLTSLAGVAGGWANAVGALVLFVILFGYDVLCEVLAGGRTLGKRWSGIRVVDRSGGPVRLVPSVVRNLLRLIDILPGFYLVGAITLFVSKRNQRLGDMAAGTYVVRERVTPPPLAWAPPDIGDKVAAWDVTLVTADEVATVRRFLERRADLLAPARRRLATDLATRLRAKVSGPDPGMPDELFLEHLVAAKAR